ncbi:RHS repeat-associated core domain-containing protein [Dyella humi]|uniref:RHS repeat-associated core domain-containing protein n=1 Tax=Dyella humi TaxID=1770547 RepID=A0ABW8ID16_9GAMM
MLFAGTHAFAQTGGTVTYVYTDPQGTPLAETDASGNITATFEYTPYGTYAPQGTSTPGAAPKGPGYTGHVNDPETNLVYMQARYYDPATGRFLSVDSVKPVAADKFNFNRFAYANDNPERYTDPTGRCIGGHAGQDEPCDPTPTMQRPTPPPPAVSPEVQRMRDASDKRGGTSIHQVASSSSNSESGGFSFSGALVGSPTINASAMYAYGGGIQVQKSLYHDDDKVSIVTPALGANASVDAKLLEITYRGRTLKKGL